MFRYYYYDIETAPLDEYDNDQFAGLDPGKSKIISTQYQHLHPAAGILLEGIRILKEWDSFTCDK